MKKDPQNIKYNYILFYLCVFLGLLLVIFSNPFLRYPYDVFHHLIFIDDLYSAMIPKINIVGIWVDNIYIMVHNGYTQSFVEVPQDRRIWHYFWAILFYLLDIDSRQMFFRAKIIHVTQTYIALFSIYYFSKVVIRNIFKDINKLELKWLSFWSVIIWFSIFATFSGYYHQVWNMWYSVNYQITLPLFWYITALTIILLLEKISLKKKIFVVLQILFISRFILQAHSMEFMYYLMYLFIFGLIYVDKIIKFIKKYFYLFIFVIWSIWYFIKNYQTEKSVIFSYLSMDKLPKLYERIMHEGKILVEGYNRASASVNELMYFILYTVILMIFFLIWKKMRRKTINIDIKMFIFIVITSLFIMIPLYPFLGGLFGIITKIGVVNRLYYSSSLFVLFPITIYFLSKTYNIKLRYINGIFIISLISVYVFSKHNVTTSHNYYKNIQSIKNSFVERKVGFNLSKKQIAVIGQKLYDYEAQNNTNKKVFYYARSDISFVIKYMYKREVYWKGRRANFKYKKIYEKNKYNNIYYQVLFDIPKNFPTYNPYE